MSLSSLVKMKTVGLGCGGLAAAVLLGRLLLGLGLLGRGSRLLGGLLLGLAPAAAVRAAASGALLAGVQVAVPATALELEGGRADQLLDLPGLALGAGLDGLVRHLLPLLEPVSALPALV